MIDQTGGSAPTALPPPPAPPTSPVVVITDDQIAARLVDLYCHWRDDDQTELDGTMETDVDGVLALLNEIRADTCTLVLPSFTYTIQRSTHGSRKLFYTSEPNEAQSDEDGVGNEDGAPPSPPPPPPPPQPPPLQVAPRSSTRQPKRKERYGDNGELDGAASSFRSAPSSRKASVDPSVEMGVPAYALPGEQVWAMGLRAGVRMRFKAEVINLRKQFPRIVVRYMATEDGEMSRHVLPDMITAYLHMGDVEERDW